ncbi:type IV CRISPR-associated protein Csf2 [Paraburkholderia youngii]|uniref:type IV CRISPR-associated protein Csf2 n=1 Tax=Paraburkholderia youngii TaxID=2782701 RepID=UPI003D20261C
MAFRRSRTSRGTICAGVSGVLRRNGVLDYVTVSGQVPLELYGGINVGAISKSPDNAGLTVEEVLRARDNVHMGLFGGGARIQRSRYRVSDLIPIIQATLDAGMVPAGYANGDGKYWVPVIQTTNGPVPVQGYQLLEKTTIYRRDDVLTVTRPEEIEKFVANAKESVAEYQAFVFDSIRKSKDDRANKDIKKQDAAKQQGMQNIMVYQQIVAGTPMYFRVDLNDTATDSSVGLLLLAIQDLVREQQLGGIVRGGLGQYVADLTLTRRGEDYPVFNGEWAGEDATLSASVQKFIDAAHEGLAKLSVNDLMEFYIPRGGDKEKKSAAKTED